MSEEQSGAAGEPKEEAERNGEAAPESAKEKEAERVDADGLPVDRAPTIDDVRSRSGLHGKFALGCALLVVALIAAFWAIRSSLG